MGSTLRVVSTQFHNTSPLTFSVSIHLIAKSFQNISKIIAPKWRLESQSFRQGLDNSLYGEIKAERLLSIVVEETVDNRYGKIQGKDTVFVKSLRGEVLNGSSIQVYKRKDSCVPPIGCPDGKRFEFTTDEAMPSYVANEAFIASSGDLHLEGFNVATDFGGLLSMGSIHLKAVN